MTMPRPSAVGRRQSACLSCLLAIAVILSAGCRCSRLSTANLCGSVSDVTLPVVHEEGWAVVEGTIDDRPARILVDTGAGGTFVSATLLDARPGWFTVGELCFGELCVEDHAVWAQDTEITPAHAGPDRVDAVVGSNLLKDAIVELDHGSSVRIAFGGVACEGDSVEVSVDDYARPFVPIVVQGVPLDDALVDTGSLYSLLRWADVELIGGIGETEPVELCTLERCRSAQLGRATEVCAAGLCEEDVALKVPGHPILGDSFFNAAHYAIDIGGRRMTRCR